MLKTAILFQDHMVLQRGKCVPVWGSAAAGETVTVTVQGQTASAKAGADGSWTVLLGPLEASFAETVTVSAGAETLTFTDVAVGEVWLAGGQSNMEFHMRYDADMAEEKPRCTDGDLRFFDYPEVSYVGQIKEADYGKEYGFWRKCAPEQLERFSAVGYYFAKDLRRALEVPVGIVGCNWGGTPACAWMDREAVARGGGQAFLDEYEAAVRDLDLEAYEKNFRANPANWKTDQLGEVFGDLMMFGATMEEFAQKLAEAGVDLSTVANYGPQIGPKYERRPGGLYEAMLRPVAPYGIRGVIWYQGETDGDTHPELYATVFPEMIRCWRALWGEPLPFLFVQIAPLDRWMECVGTPYAVIRRAQQHTADTVEHTGMAVITDVGMEHDIHPKKKQPVGHRLALQALRKVYGREDVLCEAPTLTSCEARDGALVLTFANAGDGLHLAANAPYGQEIGADRLGGVRVTQDGTEFTERDFTARAEGDTVVLTNEKLRAGAKTHVSLAETGWYLVNLYNSADIPARPAEL